MLFRMTIWTIKISRTCCNQIVQWWDWLIRKRIFQMMFAVDDDDVDQNMNLSPSPSQTSTSPSLSLLIITNISSLSWSSSHNHDHRCHDDRHIMMIIVVMIIVTLSWSSLLWSLSHWPGKELRECWTRVDCTRHGAVQSARPGIATNFHRRHHHQDHDHHWHHHHTH